MSDNGLTIKRIEDDGRRWPSIVMQQSADNSFEDCSLDRNESAVEAPVAG